MPMKKYLYTLIISLNFLFISIFPTIAAPLPEISAEGAILMEAKTGTILYAKNINSLFYPASTTKVLTTLILAEEEDPNEIISKSKESLVNVPSDSSHIGLNMGDRYSAFDGLHGILMGSDNYISYDMAIENAGSITNFANKMNDTAYKLGARSSHFVNPHGYHDPNHYTTPYDLALITRAAFANPEVAEIAGTDKYNFKVLNRNQSLDLTHSAALFDSSSPYYNPNVVAAKTGFHTPAGRTLVAKAVYGDLELIGVVMKTKSPLQFKDMNTLFQYGSNNFRLIGTSDTGLRVDNVSYSEWSKPYIEYALDNNWISLTTESYQSPISSRVFLNLLSKIVPEEYISDWEIYSISALSPSLLNQTITGKEASSILETLYNKLVPTNSLTPSLPLEFSAINPNAQLTLEEAIYLTYYFDKVVSVSPPYVFLYTK